MMRYAVKLVALGVALGVVAVACAAGVADEAAERGAEQAEGLVRPIRQVKINAAVAGKLVDMAVTEGAVVDAGQTLGQIDDQVQRAAVAAAKVQAESTAEVDHAALQLAEAKVSLEEMTSAYKKQAANEWEVRRATLQVKLGEAAENVARNKLDYARAQLALEQARLKQYRLVAPFAGTVVRIDAEIGQTLTPQVTVLTLVDLSALEAEVYVPADWYGRLKVGETYSLQAAAPVNAAIVGKLRFINPVIDPAARMFRCLFEIDNSTRRLPAGFTVRLARPG